MIKPRRIAVVPSSQAMVLDAYYAETFVILLRGNVTSLKMKNVTPGRLYVLIVKMDALGDHEITSSQQFKNATQIDPLPNSVTVQCFIGLTGGMLLSISAGAWT